MVVFENEEAAKAVAARAGDLMPANAPIKIVSIEVFEVGVSSCPARDDGVRGAARRAVGAASPRLDPAPASADYWGLVKGLARLTLAAVLAGCSSGGADSDEAARRWARLADAGWVNEPRSLDDIRRDFDSDDYNCDVEEIDVTFHVASSGAVALHVAWCPETDPTELAEAVAGPASFAAIERVATEMLADAEDS